VLHHFNHFTEWSITKLHRLKVIAQWITLDAHLRPQTAPVWITSHCVLGDILTATWQLYDGVMKHVIEELSPDNLQLLVYKVWLWQVLSSGQTSWQHQTLHLLYPAANFHVVLISLEPGTDCTVLKGHTKTLNCQNQNLSLAL